MSKYNILRSISYFLLVMLCYLILITTFNYFDIISFKAIGIISFIFITLCFLGSGFFLAMNSNKKGYKSGALIGFINILLLFVLSLILQCEIKTGILLYFLIMIMASTLGGMFGINFNNKLNEQG